MAKSNKLPEPGAGQGKVPSATYRLQFNQTFTFAQAQEVSEYLRALGVSDVYASPLFQAGPQSTHGYDICSFEQLSPALGKRADFDQWTARLRELGLGLLLDMVPNHMGNDLSNHWWLDVLQLGRASRFASYFDIDWQPLKSDLHDKILLPTLEDHYSAVLESGKLRLVRSPDGFRIAYYESFFPIAPLSCVGLLDDVAAILARDPASQPLGDEVRALTAQIRKAQNSPEALAASATAIAGHIQQWTGSAPAFAQAMDQVCQDYAGQPAQPQSFDKLHRLLSQQHYRLAWWRVGPEEINYRRFFDVTQLVSVRMELPEVYAASHRLIGELLRSRQVTGLRIDHPDGLWDPKEYFRRLQLSFLGVDIPGSGAPGDKAGGDAARWLDAQLDRIEREEFHRPIAHGEGHTLEAPRSDPLAGKSARPPWPLFVVAEKILKDDERLRRDWPVEGTTGYDFLNQVNGLFVNSAAEGQFNLLYQRFSGNELTFEESVYAGKKCILDASLISELRALTHRLKQLTVATRYGQDFTFSQLHAALSEIIANFPVYRSYLTESSTAVLPIERFYLEQAIAKTKERRPDLDLVLLNFIQDLLLLRVPADFDEAAKQRSREFVLRFQQLTGPVTAKGLEDTAFYTYNRLISLNDVGGDPSRFGLSVDEFHQSNLLKAEQWPHALLATATHDTKRGEDVRARINVLSELPEAWAAALERWSLANRDKKSSVADVPAPHPNDEYLLYQTLVGAWPSQPDPDAALDLETFRDRITEYMLKAVKEAKTRTSWTQPNSAYEDALKRFIAKILDAQQSAPFLDHLTAFQRRIGFFGVFNSLAQLLLKLTVPGIPDLYQGTELWDLSLVDPDNRRPVDYQLRRRMLRELADQGSAQKSTPELLAHLLPQAHTGAVKLYLLWRTLQFRAKRQELFRDGAYLPLRAAGPKSTHVCAFARVFKDQVSLTVVPRLCVGLTEGRPEQPIGNAVWDEATLDLSAAPVLPGRYRNILTGETLAAAGATLPLAQILRTFPVALLERISPAPPSAT